MSLLVPLLFLPLILLLMHPQLLLTITPHRAHSTLYPVVSLPSNLPILSHPLIFHFFHINHLPGRPFRLPVPNSDLRPIILVPTTSVMTAKRRIIYIPQNPASPACHTLAKLFFRVVHTLRD